jgi:hypothetical protein
MWFSDQPTRRNKASARKVHAVFGQGDAEKIKHRPEKLVAGLNPAISVFGPADAKKERNRKTQWLKRDGPGPSS